MTCRVEYWGWNAGLSAADVRVQVLVGLLARSNGRAAWPQCSLVAEVGGLIGGHCRIGAWRMAAGSGWSKGAAGAIGARAA